MEKRGFEENVSFSDGFDRATGIETFLHFQGDEFITQKQWDAEPHLQHAADARLATQDKRWGDGKLIGHIPPAFYANICVIKDKAERKKAVSKFFRENPAFIMFDKYKP